MNKLGIECLFKSILSAWFQSSWLVNFCFFDLLFDRLFLNATLIVFWFCLSILLFLFSLLLLLFLLVQNRFLLIEILDEVFVVYFNWVDRNFIIVTVLSNIDDNKINNINHLNIFLRDFLWHFSIQILNTISRVPQ